MTTTHEPRLTEIDYDPDCNPEQLAQVLHALDQWSDRTSGHVIHQRSSDRHHYRTTIAIEPEPSPSHSPPFRQIFHVPARNVSKSGLGFVAPPLFMPRLLSDETPLVRSEHIFRVGATLKIQLHAPGKTMPTLRAEVARLRPVHFGFFDIGVRFLARHDDAPATRTENA